MESPSKKYSKKKNKKHETNAEQILAGTDLKASSSKRRSRVTFDISGVAESNKSKVKKLHANQADMSGVGLLADSTDSESEVEQTAKHRSKSKTVSGLNDDVDTPLSKSVLKEKVLEEMSKSKVRLDEVRPVSSSDSDSSEDSPHSSDKDVSSLSEEEDEPSLPGARNANVTGILKTGLKSVAIENQNASLGWEDLSSKSKEVWLVKMPINLDVNLLDGKMVSLKNIQSVCQVDKQVCSVSYVSRPQKANTRENSLSTTLVLKSKEEDSDQTWKSVPKELTGTIDICEVADLPQITLPGPKSKRPKLENAVLKQRFVPLGADFTSCSPTKGRKSKKRKRT